MIYFNNNRETCVICELTCFSCNYMSLKVFFFKLINNQNKLQSMFANFIDKEIKHKNDQKSIAAVSALF